MTQYIVQNETNYNINSPVLSSLATDADSYDDEEAVMTSYSDEPAPAFVEDDSLAMMDTEQGVFYAYGDADETGYSQLFMISEVMDEDTGQLIRVAIPITADDSATTTTAVSSNTEHDLTTVTAQNEMVLENAGEVVGQLLEDVSAGADMIGGSAESAEVLHANDGIQTTDGQLPSYIISEDAETGGLDLMDTTLSFNAQNENAETTEITVQEEGVDEGNGEQTTTEFEIIQHGNRVIVRNSEGKIVNEFPLPASPNLFETMTLSFNPYETDIVNAEIETNLTKTQSASDSKPLVAPETTTYKPAVRRKRVYPGKSSQKNLVNSTDATFTPFPFEEPQLDPNLPPNSKVDVIRLSNTTDDDPSGKPDLPFCYSGQKFSLQSQKLILNVYDFFKKVNKGARPSLGSGTPSEKAATVLNVSSSVISRVNKRFKEGLIDFTKESLPQRKEGLKRVVDVISTDDENELKNIIHDFAKQGITPTVPVLLQEARQKIGFPGSRSSLRRILHRMGFKYAKIDKKNVIISIVKEDQQQQPPAAPSSLPSASKNPNPTTSAPTAVTPNSESVSGTSFSAGSLNDTQMREPPIIKFYYGPLDDEPKQKQVTASNGPIPKEILTTSIPPHTKSTSTHL